MIKNTTVELKPTRERRIEREPLTLKQAQDLMAAADNEWKGMILTSLHTGQRMMDIAVLTWNSVNFEDRTLRFYFAKQGRPFIAPMTEDLHAYYASQAKPADGKAPGVPLMLQRLSGRLWAPRSTLPLAPAEGWAEAGGLLQPSVYVYLWPEAAGSGHAARPTGDRGCGLALYAGADGGSPEDVDEAAAAEVGGKRLKNHPQAGREGWSAGFVRSGLQPYAEPGCGNILRCLPN